MQPLECSEEQDALKTNHQREHEELRANVRQQSKIDHALAVIDRALADDLARRDAGAEPDGDEREHEVREVARLLLSNHEVSQ